MELSLRLASCEMKSMPSLLMAPHVLIAMMTRRMFRHHSKQLKRFPQQETQTTTTPPSARPRAEPLNAR